MKNRCKFSIFHGFTIKVFFTEKNWFFFQSLCSTNLLTSTQLRFSSLSPKFFKWKITSIFCTRETDHAINLIIFFSFKIHEKNNRIPEVSKRHNDNFIWKKTFKSGFGSVLTRFRPECFWIELKHAFSCAKWDRLETYFFLQIFSYNETYFPLLAPSWKNIYMINRFLYADLRET